MSKPGFQIFSSKEDAEIYVYGGINVSDNAGYMVDAAEFSDAVQAIEAKKITVRIASVGGDPVGAGEMYQALVDHPATVTTVVDSRAYSAGSMILQAGDKRIARPLSMIMVHGPSMGINGSAKDHMNAAAALNAHAEMMVSAYTRHGLEESTVRGWIGSDQDFYFSAKEALAAKLIDEIAESVQLAASAPEDYRIAAMGGDVNPADLSAQPEQRSKMSDDTQAVNKAADTKTNDIVAKHSRTVTQAKQAGIKAEAERRKSISAVFDDFYDADPLNPISALHDECMDDVQCDELQARRKLLAYLANKTAEPIVAREQYGMEQRPSAPPHASPHLGGAVTAGLDQLDKMKEGVTAALMVRAGVATPEIRATVDGANPWRGIRLTALAAECVQRAGVQTRGMDEMKIIAAAFTQSTSDFPILLEDAMHKTMLNAYRITPDTWSRWCATGTVSDFRPHHRYRSASIGNYMAVNENGEFRNVHVPDGERSIVTADTKGLIVNLSRQMVKNDDLGAFLGMAAQIGRSGRRTIESAVYALLGENSGLGPTQADGQPLFHSNRANVGASAVNSVAQWDAMAQIMAAQKDVGGNDNLDIEPAVWVGPRALRGVARGVNEAEFDDEAQKNQRKPNISRGLVRDIVSTSRLTGNRYYLFADPAEAPVIEVSFLDGQQEPVLEQMEGFDVDGTRYKGRLDFGVSEVDYRGAVTSAGG